ncbi:MAG: MFS transporter [Streptosporangiaceae bacterium]
MGAWQERNFRLLFIGQTVSSLGNTLVPVALAFGILDLTGSASDFGYVLGAGALAQVLFMLAGGVIADRVSRRALMMAADAARCAAQLVLGVLLLAGHPAVATLAGLNAVVGIAGALFQPASSGLLPALVRPEHLQQANALQQTSSAGAGIAGPAVAGLLVVTVGPGWGIIANAVTFAVSVILLAQLRLARVLRPERSRWIRDLREGWQDFWARRWFRSVVLTFSAINLIYAAYQVLGPVASKRYYHGAGSWAIIATAAAAGSVLAGLPAIRLRPRYPLRVAVLSGLMIGLPALAFAASLPLPVIAVAAALDGAGLVVCESLWQTSVQRHIPDELLSRASSYDYVGSFAAVPAGLAVAGPVMGVLGLRPELLAVGGLSVLLTAGMLLLPSVRDLRDTPDHPDPDTPNPVGSAHGA